MSKKYGRSLSFCVKDILEDKISIDDVGVIVSSTACKSNDDWNKLIDEYSETYYKKFPKNEVRQIIWYLLDNGHIYQPRLVNGMIQNLADYPEHWVNTYQEALASLKT